MSDNDKVNILWFGNVERKFTYIVHNDLKYSMDALPMINYASWIIRVKVKVKFDKNQYITAHTLTFKADCDERLWIVNYE